jgi:uncharacterized repeat protein (TIGR01451 family)
MTPARSFAILALLAVPLAPAAASPCVPAAYCRAPLLYVRLIGPPESHLTFFQGQVRRQFLAPQVVGLRPGYIYRFELSGLPGRPGVSFYPTLEVRGTLNVPPMVRASQFPAAVVLSEADLEAAGNGTLVTKVVYLENPTQATPQATTPDAPLEVTLPARDDLLAQAREVGRPMLVVRLGQRPFQIEELKAESVPGTMLMPGEQNLTLPTAPPILPYVCFPWYDPKLGPCGPLEELVCDGGDHGLKAGIGPDGRVANVEPEDTVAEWVDAQGFKHVTHSNCVCLLAPRFAVLRNELPLARTETLTHPGATKLVESRVLMQTNTPSVTTQQAEALAGMRGRSRPSGTESSEGIVRILRLEVLQAEQMMAGPIAALGTQEIKKLTELERVELRKQLEFTRVIGRLSGLAGLIQQEHTEVAARVVGGPEVVKGRVETRDLTVCCEEVPCLPDKPLVLVKCADRHSAQVGDVVEFTLRYSNQGSKVFTDVAVTDSLTTRLEYVPGSARSDRDAVFTMQENEAGSLLLRWEVTGTLQPGTGGIIKFKARVR